MMFIDAKKKLDEAVKEAATIETLEEALKKENEICDHCAEVIWAVSYVEPEPEPERESESESESESKSKSKSESESESEGESESESESEDDF